MALIRRYTIAAGQIGRSRTVGSQTPATLIPGPRRSTIAMKALAYGIVIGFGSVVVEIGVRALRQWLERRRGG
ncbi:hypothetical protein BDK88_3662 [Natrinema hispanicum]|uniref:Uncharacterized protein n=1 Tax=Natrinema hispanicum TaxID=392421 RepID=A0A482Y347_9EURY|nr:hypothetical protein BDK88_3662 [Natrinema hispanicum]